MAWDPQPRARSPEEQLGYDVIGRLLRRRRRLLGWSQRYLEYRSGIDQPVISRLENGKQFGVRWARFATLVGSMGGLGDEPYPRDLPDPPSPRPSPPIDLWGGGTGLDIFDDGALLPDADQDFASRAPTPRLRDQASPDRDALFAGDADEWHRCED
jgi:transcriptional regulator with XRE-family HTH domain